jgi:Ser-tRNA(Ala) deacylase AlaX
VTRSARAAAALAVLALAVLAGCGKTEVDRAQLETQVQRSLEDMANPKLDVRTVSCPDHLAAQKGAQTHCSITTGSGKTVSALVTVTGTANNRLQFDLKLEQNPRS